MLTIDLRGSEIGFAKSRRKQLHVPIKLSKKNEVNRTSG